MKLEGRESQDHGIQPQVICSERPNLIYILMWPWPSVAVNQIHNGLLMKARFITAQHLTDMSEFDIHVYNR